jgi:hypothetical protein
MLATLATSLLLSGCAGTLQPAGQTLGIATATRGIEPQAARTETSPFAGATLTAPEVQVPAGPPAETATVPPPIDAQPTTAPPAAVTPTVNPALANVQLPSPADLQERWRQMQVDRAPFDAPRTYTSQGYQIVWWFDPLFGQIVPVGQLRGDFTAQATFRIRGMWISALEIPYHVNQEYGFTVPDPILQRMRSAGVGEWAEVFVYQTEDMQPK